MKEFRAESQLRELTSLESGRALADTPKGIYAYASLSSLVPPYGLLRSKLSDDEIAVLFEQYVRRATAQGIPPIRVPTWSFTTTRVDGYRS
jgi:hypothetical protein